MFGSGKTSLRSEISGTTTYPGLFGVITMACPQTSRKDDAESQKRGILAMMKMVQYRRIRRKI